VRSKTIFRAAVVCGILLPARAPAQTLYTAFPVVATVMPACQIKNLPGDSGAYQENEGNQGVQGDTGEISQVAAADRLTVKCSAGTDATIRVLGGGQDELAMHVTWQEPEYIKYEIFEGDDGGALMRSGEWQGEVSILPERGAELHYAAYVVPRQDFLSPAEPDATIVSIEF
jgi:hypothetical protein